MEDFNKTYNEYHSVQHGKKFGYRSRQVRLKEQAVNELRMSADIDPSASFKTADEEYVEKLSPEERDVLFKVIRRMIRDKKRHDRVKLMEDGQTKEAEALHVSDDSDSEGEFDISVREIEKEFTDVLDEIVFGRNAVNAAKINESSSFKIAEKMAASIKHAYPSELSLADREKEIRANLTTRYAKREVKKKYLEKERADPLADALLVYVSEGKSKKEIDDNLQKLQAEKRKAIEERMEKKKQKHEAQIRKLKEKVLRGESSIDSDLAPETIALRKLKEKQDQGIQAVNKIQCM